MGPARIKNVALTSSNFAVVITLRRTKFETSILKSITIAAKNTIMLPLLHSRCRTDIDYQTNELVNIFN